MPTFLDLGQHHVTSSINLSKLDLYAVLITPPFPNTPQSLTVLYIPPKAQKYSVPTLFNNIVNITLNISHTRTVLSTMSPIKRTSIRRVTSTNLFPSLTLALDYTLTYLNDHPQMYKKEELSKITFSGK